jgi:hypothetical protein
MIRVKQYLLCFSLSLLLSGCSPQWAPQEQRRGDKTREVVAKATHRMKPELEWSARKIGQAAEWAADETLAAIEGFFEGWFAPSAHPINLNSATEPQLKSLPGIDAGDAERIIRSRPYRNKRDLVKRGVISETTYARISDLIKVE